FTVFHWLLPFVEENALFTAANYNTNNTANGVPIHYNVVNSYMCPVDPSPYGVGTPPKGEGYGATTYGSADRWATSNYAANYLVFGDPAKGSLEGRSRLPISVPDGLTNTVFYTERYRTCGNDTTQPNGATTSCNLWGDSNGHWRPSFCTNNIDKNAPAAGYPQCKMFQVK